MGWLRSHGIIRIGNRGIEGYYVRDDWQSMLLKVEDSGYSDWFVSTDCVIQFKVTSQDTGDMEMQLDGDIGGYPYYSNDDGWNLWYASERGEWILSYEGDGPGLGEPPVASYTWNTSDEQYDYDGDEYYTGSFNYTCLDGTAGTFTHNVSGSTITLTAVWPDNFKKRTSGNTGDEVGEYTSGYAVGFPQWLATQGAHEYYIHRLKPTKFGHLHYFDTNYMDLEDITLRQQLTGFWHDQLGEPTFDPASGFYFHQGGSSSFPATGNDYTFRWCHYVPDEPAPGETESHSGVFVFDSSTHPDITFTYQERVFETDVVEDNKGLVYMTDTSSWR